MGPPADQDLGGTCGRDPTHATSSRGGRRRSVVRLGAPGAAGTFLAEDGGAGGQAGGTKGEYEGIQYGP